MAPTRKNLSHLDRELDELFDHRCALCGGAGSLYGEKDHIMDWAYTHNDSSENLWPLCHRCHRECKPVLKAFLGTDFLYKLRGHRIWWTKEKRYLLSLIESSDVGTIAKRIQQPSYIQFLTFCNGYEQVSEFLEHCVIRRFSGERREDTQLAVAEISLFLAVLFDRCKNLLLAEQSASRVLRIGRNLTLNNHPMVGQAQDCLAHTLIKYNTRASLRRAAVLMNSDCRSISYSNTSLLNRMQLSCEIGNHDAVTNLFQRVLHQRDASLLSNSYEILGYDRFLLSKFDEAQDCDEKSFMLALYLGAPRTIMLRSINLVRSSQSNDPQLAAQAMLFARAFRFAAVGVGDTQLRLMDANLSVVSQEVSDCANRLKAVKDVDKKFGAMHQICDARAKNFPHLAQ